MTEEGLYTGGNYAYGYQLIASGRKNKKGHEMRDLAIEPAEAEIVSRIFRLTVFEGYGSYQLADMLNREGHRTHGGAEFQSNTILRILKNPIYIGYMVNGDTRSVRLESLRIIPDEHFEMAQKILDQRASKNSDKRTIALQNQGKALLSGNIFCGHCGCRLATSRYKETYTRKDGSQYSAEYGRYVCYHRSRGLNDCDGASTYKADKIDDAVMELMRTIFSKISGCPEEEKIQSAYKKMMAANHQLQKKLESELEKYQKQLDALRLEISKALAGDSIFTQEDLTLSLQNLKTNIAHHEDKLAQLKNEDQQKREVADNVIPAYRQFQTWAEEFDNASFEAKKMIANQLFHRIEVFKGYRLNIELNLTYRQFLEGWTASDTIDVGA